eukprot:7923636-Karenia_brevis.AAC.1
MAAKAKQAGQGLRNGMPPCANGIAARPVVDRTPSRRRVRRIPSCSRVSYPAAGGLGRCFP